MKSGQFVVGMINGVIEPFQSNDAEQLLDEREFAKLWNLGETHEPGTYTYVNEQERVLAYSIITEKSDGEGTGRKGSLNHTVIIKFSENILSDILAYTSLGQKLIQPMPTLKNPLPKPEIEKVKQ